MTLAARSRRALRAAPPALPADAALLLDFDGTLVPIADRPTDVQVPAVLPLLLEGLQRRLGGALALVTGRALFDLDRMLWPLEPAGAGVHGAELRRHAGGPITALAASASAPLARTLQIRFGNDPRILVEDKQYAVALHYRLAPEREAECRRALQVALPDDHEILAGKMVVEARPRGVSKRRAVLELMREAPFAGRRPVFVGDDRTDEDGFEAVRQAGGWAIRVGPGDSVADYALDDPDAVMAWLRRALAPR